MIVFLIEMFCYLGDSGIRKKQTGSIRVGGIARAPANHLQSLKAYPHMATVDIPGVRINEKHGKFVFFSFLSQA